MQVRSLAPNPAPQPDLSARLLPQTRGRGALPFRRIRARRRCESRRGPAPSAARRARRSHRARTWPRGAPSINAGVGISRAWRVTRARWSRPAHASRLGHDRAPHVRSSGARPGPLRYRRSALPIAAPALYAALFEGGGPLAGSGVSSARQKRQIFASRFTSSAH
jgi:hypothetical protein